MAGVIEMKKLILLILLFTTSVMGASNLPSWYPKEGFDRSGYIVSISSTELSLEDDPLVLSPTAKVSTESLKKASFSELKVGDFVGIKLIKFNNKVYIDHVYTIDITLGRL